MPGLATLPSVDLKHHLLHLFIGIGSGSGFYGASGSNQFGRTTMGVGGAVPLPPAFKNQHET